MRQQVTEAQRTQDRWRGTGSQYPACCTLRCDQGRSIRGQLDPLVQLRWTGVGPGKLFLRDRQMGSSQRVARDRLARSGLLDDVPTIDQGKD